MVKIQYISDVHLEFFYNVHKVSKHIIPLGDIMVLAGDIGYPFSGLYFQLIEYLSKCFKHVIIVAGNHEYYNKEVKKYRISTFETSYKTVKKYTVEDIDIKISQIASIFENVHFLNKSVKYITIDDQIIKFVGTTLWTKRTYIDSLQINDYHKIFTEHGNLTHENVLDFFEVERQFIVDEIQEDIPTVVITHHAPFIEPGRATTSGTELRDIITKNVKLWIFGHTHKYCNQIAPNGVTRLVNNPMGYPSERSKDRVLISGASFVEI